MAGIFGGKKDDNRFIALLIEQATKTVEGLKALQDGLDDPAKGVEALRARENEADEVRRILIDELHNTFITPIDREDLFNLSLTIDEMIDYALTTIEEMALLGVDADARIREMVNLIVQEGEELLMAAQRLSANPRVAGDHARRTKKLEGQVDHLYRRAVADLFADASDPAKMPSVLARREVYRHISNMSDRADVAANAFGMVVMKLT